MKIETIEIIQSDDGLNGPFIVKQGARSIRELCRDEVLWVIANLLVDPSRPLYNGGMLTEEQRARRAEADEARRLRSAQ